MTGRIEELARIGLARLAAEDPELLRLLEAELAEQESTLMMVASASIADPSVLVCEGMPTTNRTTEGYPGARYHAGSEVVDGIERLAVERACRAFGARDALVQPHSGSSANAAVLFSLLEPGDTLLGLDLAAGGHLTHGAKVSVTGRYFRPVAYGLDARGFIDMDAVARLAREHRPRLVICGASTYSRVIDFPRFREIADEVGAYLLADVSHIAGLVAAGEHPSPIDHAHVTTTSTYKQLNGPRGGLILLGRDADAPGPGGKGTLAQHLRRAVFPYLQSTPDLSAIAAKARALARVHTPAFRALARRIVADARALASALIGTGWPVLTGGTDNHTVLLDVRVAPGLNGAHAEGALERCGIIANRNLLPDDAGSAAAPGGLRFGTNALAARGFGPGEMAVCAGLVDRTLRAVRPRGEKAFDLDPSALESVRRDVAALCARFPLPAYPPPASATLEETPARAGRDSQD